MKGIIQDELGNLIDRLKNEDFDSEEFALKRYKASDSSKLEINGKDIYIIPGTFPYPVSSFVMELNDFSIYSDEPPGILPYIQGGFNLHGAEPSPLFVGIPLISAEQQKKIGIRWLFHEGDDEENLTMWDHLEEDEVIKKSDEVIPDQSEVISTRKDKDLSGGQSYPEPVDDVRNRREKFWWECWCARCQELMNNWRVLIPNTSKTPLPTVLGPSNSIVADNFNVIFTPDGKTSMAIASVLRTDMAQKFLKSISPWSKGDTPRPRGRHVIATIEQNLSIIETILDEETNRLEKNARKLREFYQDHLTVLKQYIGGTGQTTLRDRYTSIQDSTDLDTEVIGVKEGKDNLHINVITDNGDIEIGFHDEGHSSTMAHAAWIGAGFGHTIDDLLNVPAIKTNQSAVRTVLFNTRFNEFCRIIEDVYF